MAHRIELECVSCALCADVCPEQCIIEDVDTFVIDGDACTDCGDCVPACPVDCIIGERVQDHAATIDACLTKIESPAETPEPEPVPDP